ncbi:very short patch repair endonuclease [Paenibacillus arenilitoris]|uniref:Very short patch repair endonuclease n=1 Tax=Paenibacillus arenilitoris TaxID=2772299 RepID=A0A927CP99_9BACL|nr:very short patch repair endonuclease [Paenibacillus arenilitoris]MBD2871723.1 very short patch repair endonuclease [Paenibacillus arenilitoris]
MSDHVSKEKRSEIMRSVKSTHTKLEDRITKDLWQYGLRFRKNTKSLPGKPDISLKKKKKVVFIDSCFWHGCPDHFRLPKTNKEFWETKIKRNIKRDKEISSLYLSKNWEILRVWEHDIKFNYPDVLEKIINFLR